MLVRDCIDIQVLSRSLCLCVSFPDRPCIAMRVDGSRTGIAVASAHYSANDAWHGESRLGESGTVERLRSCQVKAAAKAVELENGQEYDGVAVGL